MPTFSYPSPAFPPDPAVTLDTPTGWTAIAAPATRLAVVADQADASFRPNVAVLMTRHSTGYPATAVLDELERLAEGLIDARLEAQFSLEMGDRHFDGRVLAHRHPAAGTLAELHLVTGVDHDGVTDVVHLVGTCGGDRVDDHLPLLRDVLSSVRIAP